MRGNYLLGAIKEPHQSWEEPRINALKCNMKGDSTLPFFLHLSNQTSYLICTFPPIAQESEVVECLACTVDLYSGGTMRTPLINDCHVPSRHSHLLLHTQCGEVALALCSLNR